MIRGQNKQYSENLAHGALTKQHLVYTNITNQKIIAYLVTSYKIISVPEWFVNKIKIIFTN